MNEFSRLAKLAQVISNALAALAAGGRIVPLGDNGAVLQELAARSADRPGTC